MNLANLINAFAASNCDKTLALAIVAKVAGRHGASRRLTQREQMYVKFAAIVAA